MDRLYLDYNCFQRPLDDVGQARIQQEAIACQEIFSLAERQTIELVWSFVHDDETFLCPFADRQAIIRSLATLCKISSEPNQEIYQLAQDFINGTRMSARDALHVASAIDTESSHFLSCDDELIVKVKKLALPLTGQNPIEYLRDDLS